MKANKKLYYLLNRINDARDIAPKGRPILLDPTDLLEKYSEVDLIQLLRKLESDEKVLEILRIPSSWDKISRKLDPYSHSTRPLSNFENAFYQLKLLPSYDKFFERIEQEEEYQEFMGIEPAEKGLSPEKFVDLAEKLASIRNTEPPSVEEDKPVDPVYRVSYSEKTREILVNGFLLAKPDFAGENEIVFSYIYKHPNERISKSQVEKENNIKLKKSLPKIIENLGFTGGRRKAFFNVSGQGVLFRNPITRKDLEELGIKYLTLK